MPCVSLGQIVIGWAEIVAVFTAMSLPLLTTIGVLWRRNESMDKKIDSIAAARQAEYERQNAAMLQAARDASSAQDAHNAAMLELTRNNQESLIRVHSETATLLAMRIELLRDIHKAVAPHSAVQDKTPT